MASALAAFAVQLVTPPLVLVAGWNLYRRLV